MRAYPVHRRKQLLAIVLASVLTTASAAPAADQAPPTPSAADVQRRLKELVRRAMPNRGFVA